MFFAIWTNWTLKFTAIFLFLEIKKTYFTIYNRDSLSHRNSLSNGHPFLEQVSKYNKSERPPLLQKKKK